MLSVKKLRKRPRHFVRFTGLSVEQFDQLLADLEPVYHQHQLQRLNRAGRRRELGAGHPFHLSLADRLLATLLYLRLYLSGALLGYLFNLDESSLSRERNWRLLPALLEVLPVPLQNHLLSAVESSAVESSAVESSAVESSAVESSAVESSAVESSAVESSAVESPEDANQGQGQAQGRGQSRGTRPKRIGTLKELLEKYPEFGEVWIDGTEQEVPKPKDKQKRKQRFSGKHKCHTLKTQVVTARTPEGRNVILHSFGGLPGSLHDHLLLRASGVMYEVPPDRPVRLDRGYEGVEQEYPRTRIVKAKRARRNHPLNVLERCYNRVINKLRMPVEHSLGHLKKFRVLAGIYRGQAKDYSDIFDCVAGLHNWRSLGHLNWAA